VVSPKERGLLTVIEPDLISDPSLRIVRSLRYSLATPSSVYCSLKSSTRMLTPVP
jgi:hypothetical protein